MLYAGPAADAAPHAHHAVQVAVSFGEPFRHRRGGEALWRTALVMALPADVEHAIEAHPGPLVLVYLEPDSAIGRPIDCALRSDQGDAEARLEGALLGLRAPKTRAEALAFVDVVAASLAGGALPVTPRHPAVAKALLYLQQLDLEAVVLERDLALHIGLSPGRLSHLFAREVGVPFRPYVLWLRIEKAAAALLDGATLTQAAHAAGFADSAQLTRTFRRMFGTTPSTIAFTVTVTFEGRPSFRGST